MIPPNILIPVILVVGIIGLIVWYKLPRKVNYT